MKSDTEFVNRWIIFKFCIGIPKIFFYSLIVGILKIITSGLPLSEYGALSATPTEGNCVEWPKAALSPTPAERKCAECPEGPLSESWRL